MKQEETDRKSTALTKFSLRPRHNKMYIKVLDFQILLTKLLR